MGRQFAVSERTIPVDIISKVTAEQPKEVSEKRKKKTQLKSQPQKQEELSILTTGMKAERVMRLLLGGGCAGGHLWMFFSDGFNLLNEIGNKIIS